MSSVVIVSTMLSSNVLTLIRSAITDVCDVYLQAIERAKLGERSISLDEMTGIQALEQENPDLSMRPSLIQRREC